MVLRIIEKALKGQGAKPLGDRAIEPLPAPVSRAHRRDRTETLSRVHRSTPDEIVAEARVFISVLLHRFARSRM